MNAVILLLALSAVTGFALRSFSWFVIVPSEAALAVLASAALHVQGFGAFAGIAIIVTCLTVHQIAYLIGLFASQRSNRPRLMRSHPGFFERFRSARCATSEKRRRRTTR
jgi:hypothetical protein